MIKILPCISLLLCILFGYTTIDSKEENIETKTNTSVCTYKQITYQKYGSTLQIQYPKICTEIQQKKIKTIIPNTTIIDEGQNCDEICNNLWAKNTSQRNNCIISCTNE